MDLSLNFADVYTARETAHRLYPDAQNITVIEHSADNIVALIDDKYALRFPKNKFAYLRSLYEKHILERLKNISTITTPHFLREYDNPPCMVTSFLAGHHISAADVRAFSQLQQQDFAKQVAQFAYSMHNAFSLTKELPLRQKLGLDELADYETWPLYLKKTIYNYTFQTSVQDKIAKQYYDEWAKRCDVPPTVVVHDDLHTQNMMFEDSRLIGILDFGDTNMGTPEQDLRQLYRISEEVMIEAAKYYQRLSGHELNKEAIKLWAIVQELSVYSKSFIKNKTSHHTFKRAARNLNEWLPEGYWGKGYDISRDSASQ